MKECHPLFLFIRWFTPEMAHQDQRDPTFQAAFLPPLLHRLRLSLAQIKHSLSILSNFRSTFPFALKQILFFPSFCWAYLIFTLKNHYWESFINLQYWLLCSNHFLNFRCRSSHRRHLNKSIAHPAQNINFTLTLLYASATSSVAITKQLALRLQNKWT